jgi:hypothetical protein
MGSDRRDFAPLLALRQRFAALGGSVSVSIAAPGSHADIRRQQLNVGWSRLTASLDKLAGNPHVTKT